MKFFNSSQDTALFKELDQHSAPLRQAANDMAVFIEAFNQQIPEINRLIQSLKKIKDIPIEQMDKGIEEIKQIYIEIEINNRSNGIFKFLKEKEFYNLLKKQDNINKEATKLAQKAFEIDKNR